MKSRLIKDIDGVFIAETASVLGDVTIGKGSSVWYGVTIRADEAPIIIGENTSIQDNSVLHMNTRIGSRCTIGHGAIVHGCTIADDVLVGMGAIILDGAKIGRECLIGAGALVTGKMDAPAGSLILGSPARVIRPCTQAELDIIHGSAEDYVEMTAELLKENAEEE